MTKYFKSNETGAIGVEWCPRMYILPKNMDILCHWCHKLSFLWFQQQNDMIPHSKENAFVGQTVTSWSVLENN